MYHVQVEISDVWVNQWIGADGAEGAYMLKLLTIAQPTKSLRMVWLTSTGS
jgi:hypothetical protein